MIQTRRNSFTVILDKNVAIIDNGKQKLNGAFSYDRGSPTGFSGCRILLICRPEFRILEKKGRAGFVIVIVNRI